MHSTYIYIVFFTKNAKFAILVKTEFPKTKKLKKCQKDRYPQIWGIPPENAKFRTSVPFLIGNFQKQKKHKK